MFKLTLSKWNTLSERKRLWLAFLLLASVTFAVYWQCMHHAFIDYDDPDYVTENLHVRAGLTWRSVSWAFQSFSVSNWHPLTWLSHMLDVQLFGLNPGAHHLTGVILHIANALLLFCLLRRATGNWGSSLAVAALFALHPLHVESVAWVAERKDVLSTFFMLITLIFYGRYAVTGRPFFYILTFVSFCLGLLAKPMLVSLPIILMLWDLWPLRRLHLPDRPPQADARPVSALRLIIEKIPFMGLALVSCLITYTAQQKGGAMSREGAMPLLFRLINALMSYVGYLKKMFWPFDLSIIYPLPHTLTLIQGAGAGAVLLLVSVVVCRGMRRYPFLFTGWLWYLVTLVPVIGLVQVGQQAMADRYTYIPLIGIFIMIAWTLPLLVEKLHIPRMTLTIAACMVVTMLAVSTYRQLAYWRNSVTLFRHASTVVSGNYIAYRILGTSLAQDGRYDEADQAFGEALRIRPDDQETYNAWGIALAQQKRFSEAESHYTAALRIDPEYADVHYNMGLLLAAEGRFSEAIGHFYGALRLQPSQPGIYLGLGKAYAGSGDFAKALGFYNHALLLDPDNAEIQMMIGLSYGMQGNIEECITWLNKALVLRPAYAEAHYNLGVALAKTGKLDEGIRHFREALRIKPGLEEAQKALDMALKRKAG